MRCRRRGHIPAMDTQQVVNDRRGRTTTTVYRCERCGKTRETVAYPWWLTYEGPWR